jgi:hypothetical protein
MGARPAQAVASDSSRNSTKSDPGTSKAKPGHNGGPRVLVPAPNPVKTADMNAKTAKPAPAKLEGVSALKRPGGQQTAVQGPAKRQPTAPLQPAAATAAIKKLPASASSTDRKKPSGARAASTSAPGAASNFFGSMQVTAKKQPAPGRASAPAPAAVSFNFMELADQVRVGAQAPAAPAATPTAAPQPTPYETPEQRDARLAWEAGRAARRLRAQARNATKVVWADDRGLGFCTSRISRKIPPRCCTMST